MLQAFQQYLEFTYKHAIKFQQRLEESPAAIVPFPQDLHPNLRQALVNKDIHGLYAHQLDSYQSVLAGFNTLLVSKTASGKTLSFFLPILQDYLQSQGQGSDSSFSVLLLYPTKALSRDQQGVLASLLSAAKATSPIGTYDGDTSRELRTQIQRSFDFIISNPDMLHSGILPNHNRNWRSFLSRLKYIVIDEVHTYRGTFGSHVANVFKRLLRVCEHHGAKPIFICSSATMGNPLEHVQALISRDMNLIDKDSAPRAQKDIYFLNPSLFLSKDGAFVRHSPNSLIVPILQEATRRKIRSICFARSRQQVERLYKSCVDGYSTLSSLIRPYRGGLLPLERRNLEHDLFTGSLNTVISTNALELGIDIGDLDLCILSGHPGTMASFWQQIGRVGRKQRHCVVILVAKDNPLDQFYLQHPEFLWSAPMEKAFVAPENPYILLSHLPCAANELALKSDCTLWPKDAYSIALKILEDKKELSSFRESYYYVGKTYPAQGVNLRGMSDYNIEIYCNGKVIGEIDPIGARDTLYKDAIYIHLGKKYMSLGLDLQKKLAEVTPVFVDYYTESTWHARVEMEEMDEHKYIQNNKLSIGLVYINRTPKLYKKIKESTRENVGYGPITLDPFEYRTQGLSFVMGEDWKTYLDSMDLRYAQCGLIGLGYIIHKLAPTLCMADYGDLCHDVALENYKSTSPSALFFYDACVGGVGYSQNIYEHFSNLAQMCLDVIKACTCTIGCPSCIPTFPPHVYDTNLEELFIQSNATKVCTQSLLEYIITGDINPVSIAFERPYGNANNKTNDFGKNDEKMEQLQKLEKQLLRASKILETNRDHVH